MRTKAVLFAFAFLCALSVHAQSYGVTYTPCDASCKNAGVDYLIPDPNFHDYGIMLLPFTPADWRFGAIEIPATNIGGTLQLVQEQHSAGPIAPKAAPLVTAVAEPRTLIERAYAATAILYSQTEDGGMRMRCTATAYEKSGDVYKFVSAAHCVGED